VVFSWFTKCAVCSQPVYAFGLILVMLLQCWLVMVVIISPIFFVLIAPIFGLIQIVFVDYTCRYNCYN
jgi:hypothetical protein